jgi:hypothetical protein
MESSGIVIFNGVVVEPVESIAGDGLHGDTGLREYRVTPEGYVGHIDHESDDSRTSK